MVKLFWGSFNFLVAYLLIGRVGKFDLREAWHVRHVGIGGLLIALMRALAFGWV